MDRTRTSHAAHLPLARAIEKLWHEERVAALPPWARTQGPPAASTPQGEGDRPDAKRTVTEAATTPRAPTCLAAAPASRVDPPPAAAASLSAPATHMLGVLTTCYVAETLPSDMTRQDIGFLHRRIRELIQVVDRKLPELLAVDGPGPLCLSGAVERILKSPRRDLLPAAALYQELLHRAPALSRRFHASLSVDEWWVVMKSVVQHPDGAQHRPS